MAARLARFLLVASVALTACRRGGSRVDPRRVAEAFAAVETRLRTTASQRELASSAAPRDSRALHDAVGHYLVCMSARDRAQCDRLEGDERAVCREVGAQVDARNAGDTHWLAVAPAMELCAAHAPAALCQRYAEAVEASDPSRCPTDERFRDCPAAASGRLADCESLGRAAEDCRRNVRDLTALRAGVAAAASTGRGAVHDVAVGLRSGEPGCLRLLREELVIGMTAGE